MRRCPTVNKMSLNACVQHGLRKSADAQGAEIHSFQLHQCKREENNLESDGGGS